MMKIRIILAVLWIPTNKNIFFWGAGGGGVKNVLTVGSGIGSGNVPDPTCQYSIVPVRPDPDT